MAADQPDKVNECLEKLALNTRSARKRFFFMETGGGSDGEKSSSWQKKEIKKKTSLVHCRFASFYYFEYHYSATTAFPSLRTWIPEPGISSSFCHGGMHSPLPPYTNLFLYFFFPQSFSISARWGVGGEEGVLGRRSAGYRVRVHVP